MRNLEKGQHIFIAFQNGKAVLDSQLRPRMYTSLENVDRWTPTVNKGKIEYVEYAPTITPPNEWVSVETPPTEQGWYHVAILDLKTGKYNVEQDLYSIELAKKHGFEPGFCKEIRWEERERIDYWCRFPSPPESRPPEGEE